MILTYAVRHLLLNTQILPGTTPRGMREGGGEREKGRPTDARNTSFIENFSSVLGNILPPSHNTTGGTSVSWGLIKGYVLNEVQ